MKRKLRAAVCEASFCKQAMESISEGEHVEKGEQMSGMNPTDDSSQPEEAMETTKEEIKAAYAEWKRMYPSALSEFDQMMSIAKERSLVVFLDYDGTLSPIVDDPNQAFISTAMRSALSNVAQYFPTFIISGRRRDKVYDFVRLANIYYVGSHGLDIMAPMMSSNSVNNACHEITIDEEGNEVILFQPAKKFLPVIKQIYMELQEKTSHIHGVLIENNKFCVSVHFRRVNEEDWSELEKTVDNIIDKYPSLYLTRGRKVTDIRPSIKWDKGRALEYILDTLGFGRCDALPLYIGDDNTDEDAFNVLQCRGQGIPIVVSSIPKRTNASYSLTEPSEVLSFLLRLSRWKRNSSN